MSRKQPEFEYLASLIVKRGSLEQRHEVRTATMQRIERFARRDDDSDPNDLSGLSADEKQALVRVVEGMQAQIGRYEQSLISEVGLILAHGTE